MFFSFKLFFLHLLPIYFCFFIFIFFPSIVPKLLFSLFFSLFNFFRIIYFDLLHFFCSFYIFFCKIFLFSVFIFIIFYFLNLSFINQKKKNLSKAIHLLFLCTSISVLDSILFSFVFFFH